MTQIISSIAVLGGLGLLFGVILTYANKILAVEEDPIIGQIREVLPGANCGGCGYSGCDPFAQAVACGEAAANGCSVGGEEVTILVSGILGIEPEIKEKQAAFVKCLGTLEKSNFRYEYFGMNSCQAAMQLAGGGPKACPYGCLGCGSCMEACQFGAIFMKDGIAFIDHDKCTACGQCVRTCPKKIIELVPYSGRAAQVACSSKDMGKAVKQNCTVGCIGCKICMKNCPHDAITVEENIAHVDYAKCTGCNICTEKCPVKIIKKAVV